MIIEMILTLSITYNFVLSVIAFAVIYDKMFKENDGREKQEGGE